MPLSSDTIKHINDALDAITFELKMLHRITNAITADRTTVTLIETSLKEIESLAKGAKQNVDTVEYIYDISVMGNVTDKLQAIKSARGLLGISLAEARTFVEGEGESVRRCTLTKEISKYDIDRHAENCIRVTKIS